MRVHRTIITTTTTIMTGIIAASKLGAVSLHVIVTSLPLPSLWTMAMFMPGVHLTTITTTMADTRK
jgi:hypothetical protein